jgi:hypothetical protein
VEASTSSCESCGRTPAARIVVRRHVGLVFLQRFLSQRVTACRPCGRELIRSNTRKTLWQGWWGPISFFFNFFVLGANANAARRLRAIGDPSLSGELVGHEPRGFDARDDVADPAEPEGKRKHRTSPAAYVVLGVVALGLVGWAWDASHHDHEGGHGTPATIEQIQLAMKDGPFLADDGSSVVVSGATCTGEGEPDVGGGYTHFDCSLAFDDGTGDEVVVHLLENDELFFKTAAG